MYLTPYQKKQLRIVVILIIGIPLTLFGIYKAVQWFVGAGADTQPQDVILANLTTNSVTITWTTESDQRGSVVPVLNGEEQSTVVDKRGDARRKTHYVELKSLEPGTKYDFRIISGEDTYTDIEGNEFTFTTANITTETPIPKPIHGKLDSSNGDDALIYAIPKDKSTYPVVTIPSSGGNWLIDLSSLRKVSDKKLYEVSDSTNLVLIAVSGVDNGGIVEGIYGELFDSSGGLTEELLIAGEIYDTYINDQAKLIAQGEDNQPTEEDTPPVNNEEEEYTQTPDKEKPDDNTAKEPVDTQFDREYQLKNDLTWINLVSADGSAASSPENYGPDTVQITNLTDVSFTILWYSENKETGYVMYGPTQEDLTDKGRDERDTISSQGEYYLHSVELTELQPETTYYIEVYSGDEKYDEIYEVTTLATQSSPPQFETIAGSTNAQEYESFVVIAEFVDKDEVGSSGTSHPISTLVDSEGTWILTIGDARDEDGGYFEKSSNDVVRFKPQYLTTPPTVEMTVGEAMSNEVELTVTEGITKFVKIPKLSDYGLLTN
jgi:hypothetical protein